jgi:hypothetical protein
MCAACAALAGHRMQYSLRRASIMGCRSMRMESQLLMVQWLLLALALLLAAS